MTKRLIARLTAYILSLSMILTSGMLVTEVSAVTAKPALSKTKLTLYTGKSSKLKVKHIPKNIKKKWNSKNKKVASVNKNGKVKAKKAGKTTIICKFIYKGKKYNKKCRVTVKKPDVIPEIINGYEAAESPSPETAKGPTEQPSPSPETTKAPTEQPSPSPEPTKAPTESPSSSPDTTKGPTEQPSPSPAPSSTPAVSPEPTNVPGPPIPGGSEDEVLSLDFEDGINSYMTGRQGEENLTVVPGGYNDNYCLLVSNRVKNWAGPQIDVTHNVNEYTSYTVCAYVKQAAGSNRTINCMWDSTDIYGERSYSTIKSVVVPTGNWKKIEATVVSPGDVKQVFIYFEMQNYANDFYVDNITVTKKRIDLEQVLAADSLKEAYSERFDMGCAVYTYHLKNPETAAFIKHHYSTVTFSDELKPERLLDEEKTKKASDGMPVIRKDIIDRCMELAKENNLKVRVHTLVWHMQTPDWYFCENYKPEYDGNGTEKKNITNLTDETTMLKRMQSYITQIITYIETKYPDVVYAYDVVNEAISESTVLRTGEESLYGGIFGAEDTTYITEAFRYAREAVTAAGSHAKLFYNDYKGYSPGQRKAIVGYLSDAKKNGDIDGIGIQSHQINLGVTDGDNIKNSLKYFKDNGYEVNITELDYASKDNSEEGNSILAQAYTKFMTNILERIDTDGVSITNVTFWGLTDLDTWLNEKYSDGPYYPLLFDENYMPKPAFKALIDLVKANTPKPSSTPTNVPTSEPAPTAGPTVKPSSGPSETPTAVPSVPPVTDGRVINLSEGNIVISDSGYTINSEDEVSYTGNYIITGGGTNSIRITGGIHNIILDEITSNPSSKSPIELSGNASVIISLRGVSVLTAPKNCAGINVPAGCELTITGDGTLKASGGDSAAAVGASYYDNATGTLGKIVIMSGTILAQNSGGNGAGIGDSKDGAGGGEIIIYGGSICAKSGRNGAGIGGGGSAVSDVKTITVKIYGGIITAGGSAYEIGDGKNQNHCEVYVYGGSIHSMNQKTLFGSRMMTEDAYTIEKISLDGITGISSVTVDGVDQGISGFPISDINGNFMTRNVMLNLYVTKNSEHEIIVTDTNGVKHTFMKFSS